MLWMYLCIKLYPYLLLLSKESQLGSELLLKRPEIYEQSLMLIINYFIHASYTTISNTGKCQFHWTLLTLCIPSLWNENVISLLYTYLIEK